MLEIDHVVLAVGDLEEAASRLRETCGLGSVPGGSHPRWGTANRIVPLGRDYVELMGIGDPELARSNDLGRRVRAAAGTASPWVTWVVRTDRLDAIAGRIGLDVIEAGRERPDGRVLRWRMAGLDEALAEPPMPFFMQWEVEPGDHPGAARADHAVEPRRIAWVEVAGQEGRLREWLGDARLPVRLVPGPAGVRRVGIATAEGELELRGSEVSPASG